MDPENPPPSKGGRPKTHRTHRVVVRLTDDELAKLQEYAKKHAKNPATLLRALATQSKLSRNTNHLDRDIQQNLLRQITGIANNINQITKLAHQGQIKDTNTIAEQVNILTRAFLSLVGKDVKQ